MWSTAALVGLLVASAAASPAAALKDHTGRVVRKRTTETVQLYAYGTNISGLPIYAGTDSRPPPHECTMHYVLFSILDLFSADVLDLAYLATDEAAANLTAVTWTIDTTGADAWTVAANTTSGVTTNSTSSLTSGSSFYVVTSSDSTDSFAQAGFVSDASSAPTGATTTGFVTYGPYVMLVEDDTSDDQETYVSEFWATASGTDGLWTLMWNEAGTSQDNSVPVALKTTAPVTSTT